MKKYLGYQVGDEVSNGIDRYEITAITKQSDGVYFSLKGKVRSVCFHELVMVNYPLAKQQRR